ncbi:MAG: cobalt-precorrin-5B (C(1))-methyltransferase [Roseofilum sp. SID2]|uniref:cobalt-precorrin-5B (C(1))-methyltransferase CbiD n=1 Tax=unclassified Roseofilum TaxID=2620099 RepID=UPI001B2A118E|nr:MULTISPECIES: cobalt-precorrin-5B (C(1))-methyltransferase CbiD [unclassified Roseofilum]MBP0013013.1 cobalt-precorrin-5B (C(1))-methyltransferase [Roseofilum sp. SID3]MBP0026292.1 cobalt-precorrin-5B (C(1))-methyltransferase [Roseofilum sp. SID2]MBP0039617.1 cobalt-precorrin-5B (C(1))-methyltransferase [Roseofilum sp. SID1]
MSSPRPGYTLPVFAAASAVAALKCLNGTQEIESVSLDLIDPAETVNVAIAEVSRIRPGMALGISHSDPGDNLDLTRYTPVWALVETLPTTASESEYRIEIEGGEGIGKQVDREGKAAIYGYARQLLDRNLKLQLSPNQRIRVTLVLPEGRNLAKRTSLEAFGIVEGLSLLGTTGISQPLSSPEQLSQFRQILQEKARQHDRLFFCLGENGLALAQQKGIDPQQIVKTANWLGPMLAEAGAQHVKEIILWGYHGKLIKLAGGIFHTHHDLADGRLEILTAYGAKVGLPGDKLHALLSAKTVQEGLEQLRQWEQESGKNWVERVYGEIVTQIDRRSGAYIYKQTQQQVTVRSVLFDSDRQIILHSCENINIRGSLL